MPSRVLEWRIPCEMMKGDNGGILPLKVFGCVCFVNDNRPIVGKLDPRAVRCVFVGYSTTQNGYVCWSPVERKQFVSMDVTFREFEPYYSLEAISSFSDWPDTGGMRREGKSSEGERLISVGTMSCPVMREESEDEEESTEEEPKNEEIPQDGGT